MEVCKNLEHFGTPLTSCRNLDASQEVVQHLKQILDRNEHKKLKYLNTSLFQVPLEQEMSVGTVNLLRSVFELSIMYNLKLENYIYLYLFRHPYVNLLSRDEQVELGEFAKQIVSLRWNNEEPFSGPAQLTFPNVEKVSGPSLRSEDYTMQLQVVIREMGLVGLRTLELITLSVPFPMMSLWGTLPKLEELLLWMNNESDENPNVFGCNENEEQPAFLQLTSEFPEFRVIPHPQRFPLALQGINQ